MDAGEKKSSAKHWSKAVAAGVLCTTFSYFIPVVHTVAPLVGGSVAGYLLHQGPTDGLKAGFLKGIFMALPAVVLALGFQDILVNISIIGRPLSTSFSVFVVVIVTHSVILGMISGFITGAVANDTRKPIPAETTAQTTSSTANTIDDTKNPYSEHTVPDKEAAVQSTTDTAEGNVERSNLMDSGQDEPKPESDSPPTTNQSRDSVQDRQETHENSSKRHCNNCGHSIDSHVNFCPSCGFESPFTETPVDQNDTITESASEAVTAETDLTETIERINQRLEPDSETARQLCRTLANRNVSETELQSAMEEAIEVLDTVAAVKEAVQPAKHRSTTDVFEDIESDLEQERGQLPAAVTPLVDQLIDAKQKLDRRENDQSEVRSDIRTVCSHAADSRDVSFQSRDPTDQVAELAESLEQGDLVIEQPTLSLSDIATTVQRDEHPSSGLSRELLDVLRNPVNKSAASSTIGDCIEVIDEHQEVREMLSDIDTEDVRNRLDSVNSELRQHDSAVHNQLSNRLRELEAKVDRPGPVDDVQLYAIYQEIVFYDRTLLPQLSRSSKMDLSDDSSQLLSDVERRIEAIEDEYISVRGDHNHSIPRHFLGLAEVMLSDASEELEGNPDRAEGILIAADGLLNRIEALYQRNEYSVMLRRLRG